VHQVHHLWSFSQLWIVGGPLTGISQSQSFSKERYSEESHVIPGLVVTQLTLQEEGEMTLIAWRIIIRHFWTESPVNSLVSKKEEDPDSFLLSRGFFSFFFLLLFHERPSLVLSVNYSRERSWRRERERRSGNDGEMYSWRNARQGVGGYISITLNSVSWVSSRGLFPRPEKEENETLLMMMMACES
jgi:hypothetical protein